MSKKVLFNDNWEFKKQNMGCTLEAVLYDAKTWQKIDIPHDWAIYDTSSFYESCEGWYKKSFYIDWNKNSHMETNLKDCRYLLRFEGIYMDSTIFVNGKKIWEWKYGYTTFEIDITEALQDGENEIVIRVVLQTPNSRWYTGGGIYRNVWLKTVPNVYLASDGIYISPLKAEDNWQVRIESEITTGSLQTAAEDKKTVSSEVMDIENYVLRHSILDQYGTVIACGEGSNKLQTIEVGAPYLWDIDTPYLYTVKTELIKDDIVVDEEINSFGFRTIRYDSESGFYLNDRHIKLHGVCEHHDLGALGAAVNRTAIKRRFTILKEMGVNAIRTAHNMCAVELIELADEMGFLINNEAFDMWERPKNTYDYARFFKDNIEADIANWIRRDRNHPCVIMWCIGNEIYDTHASERGRELTRMLMDLVHKQDPYHNAPVTLGSNYMPWENTQKCADIVKLIGYNYAEKYYKAHHVLHKDWMIYGSETGSVVQSRGIYHFPLNADILSDDDEQCSALGNSITSWGARSTEKCIIDDREAAFSAGMFIWSGFDYIGEPTPYHTKNSYFGQIDTAGFKKDSYYIYQAEWTDYKKNPMIHIFPYWDFNEGQLIDVRICSNAPKIELLFNGQSQGIFEIDHEKGQKLIGNWQLPYSKGEIRALAYDERDEIIAEDKQHSFSDSAKIILTPDKKELKADGSDLLFVEISMEDKDGYPVNNANNRVNIKVEGAGRLIGLDNGDSTDYDSYKETSRRLFSGKLIAVIAAKTISGEIKMEVTSPGLPTAQITFLTKKSKVLAGISASLENIENDIIQEIPIRKLEIISPQGKQLSKKLNSIAVEVKIYPENATYHDITWRVTNEKGVDSHIVSIHAVGSRAVLKAQGDGTFYVRAMAKNGSDKVCLLSVKDFIVSGIGTAYLNPYNFISGSLYSKTFGEIGSGNERGVATSRDGESIIVFEKLDFGSFGSDEITLPIFELGGKPTQIEIWEGIPGTEGSEQLADVVYHKKSIWNTYQEATYRLKKRLTGITAISFLLRDKVHIKGFIFKKPEKAYEQLSILAYNSLYGDDYSVNADSITGIGNNVTVTFEDMDFGTKGFKKLTICGRTGKDKNTIHIRFNSAEGEVVQLAEFQYSNTYKEEEFAMDSVTGLQTVSFVFLPGSNFDFQWFQFE